LFAPVAAAATLGLGVLPAFAQTTPAMTTTTSDCSAIHFELANPSPGARIDGNPVLSGIASDSRAMPGQGVDRVEFFLGNRDEGGMSVGTATPGLFSAPMGPDSFQTTLSLPNTTGGRDLVAYAHSAVNNSESVLSIPVALNEDPSKAFLTSATDSFSATQSCLIGSTSTTMVGAPGSMVAPAPAPVPAPAPAAAPATTAPAATTSPVMVVAPGRSLILDVGNPASGDTVKVGSYNISGNAFDANAQTGNGVSGIDIFLDNRDDGGMLLGHATFDFVNTHMWSATVTLPSNQTGLHELWFYARSSVTGQETAVSVPVTIAP